MRKSEGEREREREGQKQIARERKKEREREREYTPFVTILVRLYPGPFKMTPPISR